MNVQTVNLKPLSRALLASLCATPLAIAAQDAAPPFPVTPVQSELALALTAAAQEVQDVLDTRAPLAHNLDRLKTFEHSPATASSLKALTGEARPWSFTQRADKSAYRWTVHPLRYTAPAGGQFESSEIGVDLRLDKTGKQLSYQFDWPLLSWEDSEARIAMRDASLNATQRRGPGPLWYGDMQGKVAGIELEGRGQHAFTLQMRDLWLRSSVKEKGANLSIVQSFGIKSLEGFGQQVEDIKFAYRLDNLSRASAIALAETQRKSNLQSTPDKQDIERMLPMLQEMLRMAARNKTALKIEELSFAYHGQKALLRGRLGLNGVQDADLKDLRRLVKRIDARFELRVPVGLVREIATTVAEQQAQAQAAKGGAPGPSAENLTDALVGKVLGNGYARLENDVLVSTIEIRGDKLHVNGKLIDLPKAPAQQQEQRGPAGLHTFMQARRIGDSCTLPDYPAAVVAGDAPLELTLQFTVDPNGDLRDLRVARASAYPEYDGALLQAFGGCRFVPALRDGKPVEHNDSFILKREPGSARP